MTRVKKFHLNDEEINNLKGRRNFYGYIKDLIERDINMYLFSVVCPRLGIPSDSIELSSDCEWITLPEKNEKKEVNNGKK